MPLSFLILVGFLTGTTISYVLWPAPHRAFLLGVLIFMVEAFTALERRWQGEK